MHPMFGSVVDGLDHHYDSRNLVRFAAPHTAEYCPRLEAGRDFDQCVATFGCAPTELTDSREGFVFLWRAFSAAAPEAHYIPLFRTEKMDQRVTHLPICAGRRQV